MKRILISVMAFILLAGVAVAAEKGTTKEAQAMVKKAVAFWKENGKDKAFAEFNNSKGKFVNKDLYVYVLNSKGIAVAHGMNRSLIGKEMSGIKDTDGKVFVKAIVDHAFSKGSGWEDYKWTNPISKKIEGKTAYFEKYDNHVVVCGAYK